MTPFEISIEQGVRVASNGETSLILMETDGLLFRRRAVKGFGSEGAKQVEWAVAELDGVRVYVDGDAVIVTRKDMMP